MLQEVTNKLINGFSNLSEHTGGWQTENQFVTGFGHGIAGILAVLSCVPIHYKSPSLVSVINKGINLLDEMYSNEHNNWFNDSNKKTVGFGWCHGLPGIILSQSILYKNGYIFDKKPILYHVEEIKKKCFGAGPSICHGDIGNLIILDQISVLLGEEKLSVECHENFNSLFQCVIDPRWKNRSFRGMSSVSLMLGMTGFGQAILYFFDGGFNKSPLWIL